MFQHYRKMFLSNINIFAIEQGGGSPEERQEISTKEKLEAAKKELMKLGNTTEVTQLEEAVKEAATVSREEAGKLLLDTLVVNYFQKNGENTDGEFQSHMYAVDFDGEDSVWDTRALQAEDIIALEKYGITQEQVITALNAHIPIQKTENAYAQYSSSRKEGDEIVADKKRNAAYKEYADSRSSSDKAVYMASLEQMGDGKAMEETAARSKSEKSTIDAYSQYADSRKEGERIASMEKAYASMPADARSIDFTKIDSTAKLAELVKGGDIKFSTLKKNPDAVKALQIALKGLGFDIGKTGTKKDGVDGVYGKNMEKAVIAFQKSLGGEINVDGDAGTATLTALLEKVSPISSPTGKETLMADTPELEKLNKKTA